MRLSVEYQKFREFYKGLETGFGVNGIKTQIKNLTPKPYNQEDIEIHTYMKSASVDPNLTEG